MSSEELTAPPEHGRSLADFLADLDTVEVCAAVRHTLSQHVYDRECGVFGRKDHSLGGSYGIKDAIIKRGDCELNVPLIDLTRGSMCVLVGPNGSGKSTFFDAVMDTSTIDIDLKAGWGTLAVGSSMKHHRKKARQLRIARLEQEEILDPIEELTAFATLRQALKFFVDQFPIDDDRWVEPEGYDDNIASQEARQGIIEIASSTYALFEMQDCANVLVRDLSGGERTKLSLMLVMMSDADVALFDEPTNHLDLVTIAKLLGVFEEYKQAGVSIVNISHVSWFLKLAGTHRTLQIEKGQLGSFKSPFAKIERYIRYSPTNIDKIDWCKEGRASTGVLLEGLEGISIPDSPLSQVTFASLVPHEIRLLVGDNGSGKTTLMQYYATHTKTHHGNVAYLPQFWPQALVDSQPTTEDFFSWVIDHTYHACDVHSRNVAKNRFFTKLHGTPLDGKRRRFFDLSGGEQRLAWFLAVSSIPAVDVLMSDEPTNHMDDKMRRVITRAMIDFSVESGAVLISTHDLDLIEELESNTAVSLQLNVFDKVAGRSSISVFVGDSITAHMRARIEDAKTQGRRAV